MPSLSQYGDAESYKIGEPEETAEWYEHDETGNQTQKHLIAIVLLGELRIRSFFAGVQLCGLRINNFFAMALTQWSPLTLLS